jgi:hypothetical protein
VTSAITENPVLEGRDAVAFMAFGRGTRHKPDGEKLSHPGGKQDGPFTVSGPSGQRECPGAQARADTAASVSGIGTLLRLRTPAYYEQTIISDEQSIRS